MVAPIVRTGTSGSDTITGSTKAVDIFNMDQGGNETLFGLGFDDVFCPPSGLMRQIGGVEEGRISGPS